VGTPLKRSKSKLDGIAQARILNVEPENEDTISSKRSDSLILAVVKSHRVQFAEKAVHPFPEVWSIHWALLECINLRRGLDGTHKQHTTPLGPF
jgi:hypothetical protein